MSGRSKLPLIVVERLMDHSYITTGDGLDHGDADSSGMGYGWGKPDSPTRIQTYAAGQNANDANIWDWPHDWSS